MVSEIRAFEALQDNAVQGELHRRGRAFDGGKAAVLETKADTC